MFSLLKRAAVSCAGKRRFTGTAEACLLFPVLLPHLKIQTALLTAPARLAQEFPRLWMPIQTLIPLSSEVRPEEVKDDSTQLAGGRWPLTSVKGQSELMLLKRGCWLGAETASGLND